MENQFNDTDEKLFHYLDGSMNAQEKKFFEEALRHSPTLRQRVDEQRMLDNTLRALKLQEPSQAFSQQVMTKITQGPQSHTLSVRNGIFLLIGVITVSLLAALLVQAGIFDATGSLNAPKDFGVLSEYIKNPLPSIPVNGKLIVNGIILLNLAIGFIILDRAVLRPYFERRMRHS